MSLISFTQLQDGVTGVTASATNTPLSTIYNDYNGNITDANISPSAAIAGSKVSTATFSYPYKFYIYNTNTWTAGNTTFAKVPLDTKQFDTSNNTDVTTNYRFTAPVTGFYFFNGRASSNIGGSSLSITTLYKNGTEILRGSQAAASSSAQQNGSVVSGILLLSAGDYIEMWHLAAGGSGANGAPFTYLQGFLLAAT
jgi:hypothetical protein